MDFRTLRADEIECRVNTITDKGCSVLLYKDARADMILLDEVVGAENWQRKHEVVNGNLFCSVGIKVDGEWIWKQDVGTESNTEAEKGQASDSFKRACVNWGIGRELYTSPKLIWISDVAISDRNGKKTTYDRFVVSHIAYDDARRIVQLQIKNEKSHKVVYSFGMDAPKPAEKPKPEPQKKLEEADAKKKVISYITRHQMSEEKIKAICASYKVQKLEDLTISHCTHYIQALTRAGKNIDE